MFNLVVFSYPLCVPRGFEDSYDRQAVALAMTIYKLVGP